MNAEEYNRLVDLHADGLFRFILKNIKEEAEAQDVVQDAFERLWLNRDKVDAAKGKAWLFSTGYHIMIDNLRKTQRISHVEEVPENASFTDEAYDGTAEVLEASLAKLSEVQRSVVLLRDYEGYSYKEIADITGLNEGQVKVYIHRARTFLRGYIEKMENYTYAGQ